MATPQLRRNRERRFQPGNFYEEKSWSRGAAGDEIAAVLFLRMGAASSNLQNGGMY